MASKRARFDVANEQAVVAAILQDRGVRQRVLGQVSPGDFIGKRHSAIVEAVLRCDDVEALDPHIVRRKALRDVGEIDYLRALFDLELPVNVDEHVKGLLEDAARKEARDQCEETLESLSDRSVDFQECVASSTKVVSTLMGVGLARATGKDLAEAYIKELEARWNGEAPFVSTGFKAMDRSLTEGFAPGRVSVFFGRPGSAKTSLMVDGVRKLLRQKRKPRILVQAMEPGRTRFMDMLVSSVTQIPINFFVRSPEEIGLEDRKRIVEKTKKLLDDDRLVIMKNPYMSLPKWTNEAAMDKTEEMYAAGGFDIVIADLWQRKLSDIGPQALSHALFREQQLVRKYNLHLVILHHARRMDGKEHPTGSRPKLEDLKGSGGYEEVADQVFGLHREKVYKPMMRDDVLEIEVLKQRLGPVGDVFNADFDPSVFRLRRMRLADPLKERPPMFRRRGER